MLNSLTRGLKKLGLPDKKPFTLLMLGIGASALLVGVLSMLTGVVFIALAIYLCILSQVLEGLRIRRERLQRLSDADWPKYLDSIHSAVWAGASLEQALMDCRNFAPRNTSWAVLEFERDLASGVDLDSALNNQKARLTNPIADRFIELTRLANAVGGRGYLAALRAQSIQLRLENANWEEIATKQNWVLGTAKLAVFAPWLVLLLLSFRNETARAFQTQTGVTVLLIGLIASLLAFRLVRVLGRLPRRKRILVN